MTADKDTEAFLQDGIVRYYVDAKDAVTTFESEVQELLMRQLEAKRERGWRRFHPQQQKRGSGKALQAGVSQVEGRRQIWACLFDGDGRYIEVGIDWGPLGGRRPVLYTGSNVPGCSKLRLKKPEPPVESHTDGWLYVELDDSFQLEPTVAKLLDATDRAMAQALSAEE